MTLLSKIHIVLIEPSHMGNIGAVARSMYNMGLTKLILVNPRKLPDDEAYARASGAGCILDNAAIYDSLAEAIVHIDYLVGTSARTRKVSLPLKTIGDCCQTVLAKLDNRQIHSVGIMFGRERTGLYNEELLKCHLQAYIPSNEQYSSINLAQAVQIASYQLRITANTILDESGLPQTDQKELASTFQMENLYQHFKEMLIKTEFLNPDNPGLVMERLKSIFQRAELDNNEVKLLRGICSEAIRSSKNK